MHVTSIAPLCLAGLAAASPPALTKSQSFNGVGQIRAQWNQGDYIDLGCLTDSGKWTVNNTLCGTFTATPYTASSIYSYRLSTNQGPCYIYGARVVCDNGNTGYEAIFGVGLLSQL